jgi:membrane associated rhomboid family serine protease
MTQFRNYRPNAFPPIVKNLIIINALVYLAQVVFDKQLGVTQHLALYPVDMPQFKPYQLVTHMFTHALPPMFFHILFNMFILWMFGRVLENVWGGKRFLIYYLTCGLGAAAIHLLVQHLRYDPELVRQINIALMNGDDLALDNLIKKAGFLAPAVGASGAIMGVMVAFALLFPNTELYIMFIPIPVKAKWAILGLIALDLFGGFSNLPGDNIAHFAHLGGALTGFILVMIWNKTNRKTLY